MPELPPTPTDGPRNRLTRRLLLAVAVALAALLVVPVENWRGRRAWETARRELEGLGEPLTREALPFTPVPDEENQLAHPFLRTHFRPGAPRLGLGHPFPAGLRRVPFDLKSLQALPRKSSAPLAGLTQIPDQTEVLQLLVFDEAPLADVLEVTVRQAGFKLELVDPGEAPFTTGGQPIVVTDRWTNQTALSILQQLIQKHALSATYDPTNRTVRLGRPVPALPELLTAFDFLDEPVRQLDAARQRPQAQAIHHPDPDLPADYRHLVNLRTLAQCLASRAKLHALLGAPDQCTADLGRMRALLDLAGAEQPPTLVGAMIRVGIAGLLSDTLRELLAARLLGADQLAGLATRLGDIDLLSPVLAGLRTERVMALEWQARHADHPHHILALLQQGNTAAGLFAAPAPPAPNLLDQAQSALRSLTDTNAGRRFYARLSPRGWVDQNRARTAIWMQWQLTGVDPVRHRVNAPWMDAQAQALNARREDTVTPYNYLAQWLVNQYLRAWQTATREQAIQDAAQQAVALERFRLAHGRHPEQLTELVPGLLPRLPTDLFDGRPWRYQRTETSYRLYSLGWDARDDRGRRPAPPEDPFAWSMTEGDWIWEGDRRQP